MTLFGLSEYLLGFYWMFSIVEGYDINYQIVMSITILGIITIIALLLGMSSYVQLIFLVNKTEKVNNNK
jgi:apolipoprotein N-acyltransferase